MESKVFFEDCNIGLKRYPDKHFDFAIVDPNYGINAPKMRMGTTKKNISTATKTKGRLNSGAGKLKNRILNKSAIDWDNEPPPASYFTEIFRVSKNQIIWGGNYFNLPPTRCVLCWDKLQPWENFSQWEMAWTSLDYPAAIFRHSNTGGSNVVEKFHPTQKPIELYRWIFRKFVKQEGLKIVDTHLGSGYIRLVADAFKCDFIGFEKNEYYYTKHCEVWEKYKSQLRIENF